jgi:ribose 5-phosphate isomerase A
MDLKNFNTKSLQQKMKLNACKKAIEFLPKNGKIGLGSGSTINLFAKKIPEDTKATFYCVSKKAFKILKKKGFNVSDEICAVDIAFDGLDNILGDERNKVAIKGAGGLDFVEEKKLDYLAKKLILLMDEYKLKNNKMITIFVEVEKDYKQQFIEKMQTLQYNPKQLSKRNPNLKNKKNKFFYIIIRGNENLNKLENYIESIKGIKGCGIFSKKDFTLIIGNKKGTMVIK